MKAIKIFLLIVIIAMAGTVSFASYSAAAYGVNVFESSDQCIDEDVQMAINKGLTPLFDFNHCD